MPLAGPHLIQDGRVVPLTAAQFAALGGRPVAAAPRQPTPPTAAAPPRQPPAAPDPAARRTAQLQRVARMGGPDGAAAKRMLAKEAAAAEQEGEAAELAALPKTLEEAKGDSRALMKADMRRRVAAKAGKGPKSAMRESMERRIRAGGREPRKV